MIAAELRYHAEVRPLLRSNAKCRLQCSHRIEPLHTRIGHDLTAFACEQVAQACKFLWQEPGNEETAGESGRRKKGWCCYLHFFFIF